ncbi:hypothetical protein BCS71_07115 [Vibrio lentus]|uniref:hypothetical protein n=1 Tax=Vibrio TaxID=662 RepID=UPI0002D47AF2|nr:MULTISPECIES: hypothetical protein [Vibrio]
MDIIFTHSPSPQDIDQIYQGLGDFNRRFVPEITDESFAIFVRDKSGLWSCTNTKDRDVL